MVRDTTVRASAPDARLAVAVERLGRLPVLSATVRRVQVLAASDEFAVWVPGPARRGDEAAAALLDAVAAAFAEAGPEVAVSIGTASPAAATDSLATVLSRADEALYEAKQAGRGRAVRS